MNPDVVTENLVELLTNTVNMTSVFYDIFLNPNPMDVTLQQYNNENELITVTIPNRAKDRKVALEGQGTPEGSKEAPVGTAYVDTRAGVVYFKMSGDDAYGWAPILTRESVIPLFRNYLINRGYVTSGDVRAYLTNEGYVKSSQVASTDELGVASVDGTSILSTDGMLSVNGVVNQGPLDLDEEDSSVKKFWVGNQENFPESINNIDPNTIYFLKDSGKVYVGDMEVTCMPLTSLSDFTSLSLPTSGTEAEAAVDNGAFYIKGTSSAANQYLRLTRRYTDTSGDYKEQAFITHATATSQLLTLLVPVAKGDKVAVEYTATVANGDFGIYLSRGIRG